MSNPIQTIADKFWLIEESATHGLASHRGAQADPAYSTDGDIAVIAFDGVMGLGEHADVNTQSLINMILEAAADEEVGQVLIAANTPGGEARMGAELSEAVQMSAEAKPTIVQFNEVGASLGMFMSAHATKVYASNKQDIIGSVGTRMVFFDTSKLFADMGVEVVPFVTGQFKSMGMFGTELTGEHRDHLQSFVETIQTPFTEAVQTGRNLSAKQLEAVLTAKVFLAPQAVEVGLIDGVQTLSETLAQMKGLQPQEKITMSTTTETKPQAASFAELKSIPGASTEFICSCQEKGFTLEQARDAWMQQLTIDAETARAEAADAKVEAEKAAAAKQKEDDDNLADTSTDGAIGDATSMWEKAITEKAATFNLSRQEAALRVGRENQELRYAYIEAQRAKYGVASENRKVATSTN